LTDNRNIISAQKIMNIAKYRPIASNDDVVFFAFRINEFGKEVTTAIEQHA